MIFVFCVCDRRQHGHFFFAHARIFCITHLPMTTIRSSNTIGTAREVPKTVVIATNDIKIQNAAFGGLVPRKEAVFRKGAEAHMCIRLWGGYKSY